jgi:hypothetical protein
MEAWAAIAQSTGAILAVIFTVWAGVYAISHSLLPNSAKAAQSYVETISNPMDVVKNRFTKIIERARAKRVAIFIGDLDRCQCAYVVELLEGIQTLFRQAPVVFVIAADQRWLHACFEQVYGDLSGHVSRPGVPLGTLFLEKLFQFATPVPGIPPPLREAYWRYLLTSKPNEMAAELEHARAHARAEMASKGNEREMMDAVRASQDLPFAKQQALREAAVEQMASPSVQSELEHSLEKYIHL